MKLKLISLLLIATLVVAFAAGCAQKSETGKNSTNTSAPVDDSKEEEASNQVQDPLHFLSDGQIRVDTKLFSHESLGNLTVKIDGETVAFGSAKAYNGAKEFTVEGSIDFPLTAHYIITDGNALSMTGNFTAQTSDDLANLQRALTGYASRLNDSMKRMYILLTDNKDTTWNSAL